MRDEPAQEAGEAQRNRFDVAPAEDQALSSAFDSEASEAPPPAPAAPVELPQADAKSAFRQSYAAAKRRVATGASAEAIDAVAELIKTSESLGPGEQQNARELGVQLALVQKDWVSARKFAVEWMLLCGPDRTDACRAQALAALTKVAKSKSGEAAAAQDRITATRTADECLLKGEAAVRAHAPLPPCLESAASTYRRQSDRLMLARAHLCKASSAAVDKAHAAEGLGQLQRAEKDCTEDRCAAVRQRALHLLSGLLLEQGDLAGAARAMLSENKVAAQKLAPDRQPYGRSAELDRLCAQLDAREGAGSCRKLEKANTGSYQFFDYSTQKVRGEGLRPEKVKEVNEHFGVLIQDCLAQEAERITAPGSTSFNLSWSVANTGRVDQVQLGRKDQEGGPLASCLHAQFSVWRYPRFDGEAQHVEQSFAITARQRRSAGSSPR